MKHFTCLVVIAFGLWGCSDGSQLPAPSADVASAQTALSLSSNRVPLSGSVTLQMPNPALRELAIRQESTLTYVYVQSESYDVALWDKDEVLGALTLNLDEIMGVRFDEGERTLARAFPEPGRYMIIVADNLETEPENTISFEAALEVLSD